MYSVDTYIPIMAFFIGVCLLLATAGGLVTLMVTDCVEGIFSQIAYVVIIVGVLCVVSWGEIVTVIGSRPAEHSLVNPFDAWAVQDFNLWYVLMALFISTYGTMAWQNTGSYNAAGATPHEARMGGLLGRWREAGKSVVIALLAAAALAFLGHPHFAGASVAAHGAIGEIGSPQIQTQMSIPIALSHMLPVGVRGALCAVLMLGIFGCDATHLHSWGGILAQDVILPRLKRAPSPRQHIVMLRVCVAGVAGFAFLFGVFFKQTEYIVMWWQVTMAVYIGGAGAAIIGGLYWKKGTSAGAWAAMITGSVLSGGGILAYKLLGDDFLARLLLWVGVGVPAFTLNGIQISFFSALIASALYILVSLLTCRCDFPLDRMLHRDASAPRAERQKWTLGRILGFDTEYSRGDKWITGSLFVWAVLWFGVLIVGTAWNLVGQWGWFSWLRPWSNDTWLAFWHVTGIGLPIFITVVTGVWFTWGGIRDIRALFRSLRSYKIDDSDNGSVQQHKPY